MHKRVAAGLAAGAIFLGAAGASLVIPNLVAAADPTTSPAATPSAITNAGSGSSSTQASPSTSGTTGSTTTDCAGGPGGAGLGSDDITAAAQALGMSEADVTTALQSGQTLAQVAATQNVDVQTVIDAMVAAEKAEIQAKVDDGTITQAQADQQIANLTQHETDEVNGVIGGPGGHHGRGPNDSTSGTPSGSSTTTTSGSATN